MEIGVECPLGYKQFGHVHDGKTCLGALEHRSEIASEDMCLNSDDRLRSSAIPTIDSNFIDALRRNMR